MEAAITIVACGMIAGMFLTAIYCAIVMYNKRNKK